MCFQCSSLRLWEEKRKEFTLSWNQGACPAWCHGMHYSCKWAGDVRTKSSGMFYWSTLIHAERRFLHWRGAFRMDQCPVVTYSDISIWQEVKTGGLSESFSVKETRTSSEERGRRKVWPDRTGEDCFVSDLAHPVTPPTCCSAVLTTSGKDMMTSWCSRIHFQPTEQRF